MQVEAIYNNGELHFTHPIKLKNNQVRLMVIVPDDELLSTAETTITKNDLSVVSVAGSLSEQMRAILAPYQDILQRRDRSIPLDYEALRDEYLIEKYLGDRQ